MKPVIFTCHNHLIEPKIVEYQTRVLDKIRGTIPFVNLRYNFTLDQFDHGDVLNRGIIQLFYYQGYDAILILDIDAIPLNTVTLMKTFELAYAGNLVGNIQRANHCNNGQHTYAAPSYFCFTRDTYEMVGSPNLSHTNKYDTGEMLTVNCERFGIPVTKFMPMHSEAPVTPEGTYWDLADGMPKYGHGTTFEYNGMPMSYHLFNSVRNEHSQLFYDKCEQLLAEKS